MIAAAVLLFFQAFFKMQNVLVRIVDQTRS